MDFVYLKCVKEFGKLRVKVTTTGYYKEANTQFPKDIRQEGRRYKVKMSDISMVQTRGKYFYTVKRKSNIIILNDDELDETMIDLSKIKIHTDENMDDCIICMDNKKEIVFMTCGHFYTCNECSLKVNKCPICRNMISKRIKKEDIII